MKYAFKTYSMPLHDNQSLDNRLWYEQEHGWEFVSSCFIPKEGLKLFFRRPQETGL